VKRLRWCARTAMVRVLFGKLRHAVRNVRPCPCSEDEVDAKEFSFQAPQRRQKLIFLFGAFSAHSTGME